ncbi:MAG TPA: hypothetical protein VGY77_11235 [Gemmataceae bacterium]|nr:hypothetical protein [Gemmataceae bacterium]
MRAPETAGSGVARVTFSFDAWKKSKIAPVKVEVPVNPPPGLAAQPKP